MTCRYPDHYSHNFALNIDKLPAKAIDRFSRPILIAAFVFGALLCLLGVYQAISANFGGIADLEKGLPQTHIMVHSFVSPAIFNIIVITIGTGIILSALIAFVRYKSVFFDGNNVIVENLPLFGESYSFTEPLYNYTGVRLRVKFYQYGIVNKNKFIIELYHKDAAKIVPLYITTNKNNIRQIWKDYAQALRMPGITISEKGMISRNFKDLSRSYKEVIAQWHLPKNFLFEMEKPTYISLKSRKSGEKMLRIHKLFLDAYSFLSAASVAILGSLLIYAGINHDIILQHIPNSYLMFFYALLLSIILYSLLSLATKDIILLTHDKIILFHKILFFRIRDGIINFKDVKGIDINYTPTLDRYYLAIVSDKNTMLIGNRLPAEDLRWIRAVVISEIVGN